MAKVSKPSWPVLKAALLKNFKPFNMQAKVREDILKLKQEGDKFNEYTRSFKILINQIENCAEHDKIMYYRLG